MRNSGYAARRFREGRSHVSEAAGLTLNEGEGISEAHGWDGHERRRRRTFVHRGEKKKGMMNDGWVFF